jgi:hypothetical protein
MAYEYLHEVEVVTLRSETPRPLSELLPVFTSQGFTLHDDVVSLDRGDTVPRWQHPSVVEVECQREDEEVFGFDEGEWDAVLLKYLFASLPFDNVDQFINVVVETSKRLGIRPEFQGQPVDGESLKREFNTIRDQLLSETGEDAGSEQLAILIHSTYPRR